MAEFPDFGQHCSLSSCHQLDFTPFLCDNCQRYFCGLHRFAHGTVCSLADDKKTANSSAIQSYLCSADGCFTREYVRIICSKCGHNFCLKHRHREDHKCLCSENNKILSELDTTKNPGKLLVSSSDSQTNSSEHKTNDVKKNLGEIHNKRADMIAIMRLKSKLKSEVPNSDRIFLFLIQDSRREPVMVSKKWSIGRCVYEIAKYFGIQNNNGKFDAKILRMYSASDRQVPLPMTDEAQKHLNCSEDIILRRDD